MKKATIKWLIAITTVMTLAFPGLASATPISKPISAPISSHTSVRPITLVGTIAKDGTGAILHVGSGYYALNSPDRKIIDALSKASGSLVLLSGQIKPIYYTDVRAEQHPFLGAFTVTGYQILVPHLNDSHPWGGQLQL